MAKVLCVGADDAAMRTRQMLLERAGHSVTTAKDLREMLAACEREQFAVAVLGQHLPAKEKLRVTGLVREHCGNLKILELHLSLASEMPKADAHLHANSATFPEELVEAVSLLAA